MFRLHQSLKYATILLVAWVVITSLSSCSDNDKPTHPKSDSTPPASLADFWVLHASTTSVTVSWTAVGDDSLTGQAAAYDIRCSRTAITDSLSWEQATPCTGLPLPLAPGTTQSYVVTSLYPDSTYYVAARVGDEAGNWSGLSPCDSVHTWPLFSVEGTYTTNSPSQTIITLDANRDGDPDIAKFDYHSGYRLFLNGGTGGLTMGPPINSPTGIGGAAAGDWDGDLDADMVAVAPNADSIYWLTQVAPGLFTTSPGQFVCTSPHDAVAGDWDADQDIDVAVLSYDGAIYILANDGTGTFEQTDMAPAGIAPYRIAAADLDGDLDLDLVVSNYYSASVSLYYNNGLGDFSDGQFRYAGNCPHSIAIADLNGDLLSDIAVTNVFTRTVTILPATGGGTFGDPIAIAATGYSRSIVAADFDMDGDADLALSNETLQTLTILLNSGDCSFDQVIQFPYVDVYSPAVLTKTDIDGDGDLDIAVAYHALLVYRNNTISQDIITEAVALSE